MDEALRHFRGRTPIDSLRQPCSRPVGSLGGPNIH